MPLTHTKELFAKALKGKYALGAFNVNNMELLQAIVEACEEEKAPFMLQISTFFSNGSWLPSIITLVNPSSMHSLHSSNESPWSRCTAIGMFERLTAASINFLR